MRYPTDNFAVSGRAPLRVLVVDDSPFMQRRMTELLERAGDLKVVGTARDGADAIRRSAELLPDVITMDIHMPRMDGLMAIEYIMRTRPRPIVVVSSFVTSGSAAAITALELGAIELVRKPSEGGISLDLVQVADELISKLRMAARVRVVRSAGCAVAPHTSLQRTASMAASSVPEITSGDLDTVTFIGCSTGGPAALLQLARQWRGVALPAIVVAQHLPAGFTAELAKQMSEYLGATVREAVTGDRPRNELVLIAPGGQHLVLDPGGAVRLTPRTAEDRCVPSIDKLFDSAATAFGARALGIVLTGMGNDGTAGAAAIRCAGGTVWAQDEESSIIDGMPRAVREAGHASQIFSLNEIGRAFLRQAATPLAS
jgi:two-component system chemotaxis response regulator CheB